MQKQTRFEIASAALILMGCASVGRAEEQSTKVEPKAKQGTVQTPAPKAKAGKSADVKKTHDDRDLKMIMLNQQINKKEQPVTQLTNILSKSNDTKKAIINNLK